MPRLTITEPNKPPQPYRFPVDCKLISVGKSSANDIVISSESVSNEHCLIERIKGGYIIRDNDSTNGIKQDGIPMIIGDLVNDTEVSIGDIPLHFQLSKDEIATIKKQDSTPADPVEELSISALPEAEEVPVSKKKKNLPPVPAASKPAPSTPSLIAAPESMGAGTVIMLGAFAIIVGMVIRHQLDTGSFLLTDILMKSTS